MKIEKVDFIDDWLMVNLSDQENDWQFRFCSCIQPNCPKRTLSDAKELYDEYIQINKKLRMAEEDSGTDD